MSSVRSIYEKRSIVAAIAILLAVNFSLSALPIREANAQTTHEVEITGFAFVPQNLTISLGDSIKWNNLDPVIHTLWFVFVANGSTHLLSDPIPPDTTWTHAFNDAVELQYYSFERLWITGFINVTAEVHDIAVTDVTPCKTVVSQGYCIKINATVENQGDFPETFNVTAKYDDHAIETIFDIYLDAHTSTNVTFTWDTVGVAKGNYIISAYAWPVQGETYFDDNNCTDGVVTVTIPGDCAGADPMAPPWCDGKVFWQDLLVILVGYGATPADARWTDYYLPRADFNCDNQIFWQDLLVVLVNYGQIDP